jgi:hypothetical protein
LAAGLLLLAPAVLADSQSGFPPMPTGQSPSHVQGSGQGGYLGMNPGPVTPPQVSTVPGAQLAPSAAPDDMTTWCRNSPEPSRCRARAAAEHGICVGRTPESYGHCRRAMDQMHGQ